jgi:hypothetical protein
MSLSFLGSRRLDCRMCASTALVRYLDLGHQPPADQFRTAEQIRSEPIVLYPLDVYLCETCGLSQLGYVVAPEILYQQDYPYESSTTATGRAHFAAFARSVVSTLGLGGSDLVVDIGSNVGVLLAAFGEAGVRIRGVEPAANIAAIAERNAIPTIVGFFSPQIARRIAAEEGRAAVITASNVFAHVDDLVSFMEGVEILLDDRGVFVIEAPWFLNLLDRLEYDTIYHEHVSYLTVGSLARFVERSGMTLFDVQEVDIHGGSIRLFVGRRGAWPSTPAVRQATSREERGGVRDPDRLRRFAADVERNRDALRELLYGLKRSGSRLAAVSTPAKGMTLLNYARLGTDVFDFATEKSRLKIGRYTPGSDIPVVPDSELLARRPDHALLLAWNFADEIMANLAPYAEAGGRFILPIPEPRVVARHGA